VDHTLRVRVLQCVSDPAKHAERFFLRRDVGRNLVEDRAQRAAFELFGDEEILSAIGPESKDTDEIAMRPRMRMVIARLELL